MVKKLNLFVFKSFFGPLIVTFFIALFVLLMQFLWLYIDELVGKGLSLWIIAELLFYASAHLIPTALPLAVLLASIMTFGNLGEHFELTAIKAAGISLQKVMQPLILFCIFLSLGAFYFANNLQPKANLKFYTLLYDVKQQHPTLDIREGIFNNDIDGYSIRIGDKHSSKNMMYDFMIYDHIAKTGNNKVTVADSGTIKISDDVKYMIITLYSGANYTEDEEKEDKSFKDFENREFPMQKDNFSEQTILFKLDGLEFEKSSESLFKHNYQMQNSLSLANTVDSLKGRRDEKIINFVDNMKRMKILKNEIKINSTQDTIKYGTKDSILLYTLPEKLIAICDLDSLYETYDKQTKAEIVLSAIQYAEAVQADITRTKEDVYQRTKFIAKHQVALHKKFTNSIACLIFFFIGAPLGAIIRKGGFGLPIIVSVLFFVVYYIISITGEKFVKEGVWEPISGLWGPSIILMPIGIFLTYKATTDSALLNIDTYIDNFKKILEKFCKLKRKKQNKDNNENTDNQQ